MKLTTNLFNMFFSRYVTLLRKYRILRDKISTVEKLPRNIKDISKPTQKDKPSAHSSLTLFQARSALAKLPFYNYKTHEITLVANTNSMEPGIDDNSVILAEKITSPVLIKQPLTVGDIIIYNGTRLFNKKVRVIHRIIKIRNRNGLEEFYTKGDNNFWGDGWVYKKELQTRLVVQAQTRERRKGD